MNTPSQVILQRLSIALLFIAVLFVFGASSNLYQASYHMLRATTLIDNTAEQVSDMLNRQTMHIIFKDEDSTPAPPPDLPPVASFTQDSATGDYPLTVQFTDTSTNSPTSWSWDFDGGAAASTDQNPEVTFNSPGTYTVTLTATNDEGSDDATFDIEVTYPAPVASFTMDDDTGDFPHTVVFTNTSTGDSLTYEWDFGDGSPVSTDENPTHEYASAGVYTVTLTATSPDDETDDATDSVIANTPPSANTASYNTDFETLLTEDISGLASDVDAGDSLTFAIDTDGSNGTASVNSDGTVFTYQPDADFSGDDDVVYRVTDTRGSVTTATISITVDAALAIQPVAPVPVEIDDSGTLVVPDIATGTPDPTTVEVVTDGERGTVTVNPTTGEITYRGNPGADGADVIWVTVDDTEGNPSALAPIPVIVAQPLPEITGDTYYFDATGGDDANDGLSEGNAKQTLAAANALALTVNDGVLFKKGETWTGTLTGASWANGSGGNGVIVGHYGTGALPVIQSTGSDVLDIDKNYTHIQGIHFSTDNSAVVTGDNITLAYNYLDFDGLGGGLDIRNTLNTNITGNYLRGNLLGEGLRYSNTGADVQRNVFENFLTYLWADGNASNIDYIGNRCFDYDRDDRGFNGRWLYMSGGAVTDINAYNNLVETGIGVDLRQHPDGSGVSKVSGLTGFDIRFNTFRTSNAAITTGGDLGGSDPNPGLIYNIWQSTTAGGTWLQSIGGTFTHTTSSASIAHNYADEPASYTDTDPLFVGETTHDFNLTGSSPALDLAPTGSASAVSGLDYAGNTRDSDPDYGALESVPELTYIVDDNGDYIVDENGAYIIEE